MHLIMHCANKLFSRVFQNTIKILNNDYLFETMTLKGHIVGTYWI